MDSASPAPEGFVVEWFRPDLRRSLFRAWRYGASLVAVGSLATGVVFTRLGTSVHWGAFTALGVGLVLTIAGLVLMIGSSLRVIGVDTCLVVRSDGVRLDEGERPGALYAWERIDRVSVEAGTGALCIDTDGEGPGRLRIDVRFADIDNDTLAQRLLDVRRKALMGLLRRPG
jgi:hypothetical protein